MKPNRSRTAVAGWRRRVPETAAAGLLGLVLAGGTPPAAAAQDSAPLPRIHTNEQLVEEVTARPALDISDVRQVFRHVLKSLPPRVTVYPTENYYYFWFYHNGVRYAGNLRLGVEMRARGEIAFIYFKATTGWQQDDEDNFATLGAADGVKVEKVEDLVYRVTDGDTSVTFALNDLRDVRPPEGSLAEGERYLGPVFDESGIRFFLVFDPGLKTFHFVLDETVPVSDELFHPEGFRHIMLGRRTGFAFFADGVGTRKILAGVFGPNVLENNYFDGPFDQLPDNFVAGDELKQALLAVNPDLKADEIDRFGYRKDSEVRELVAPYMEYGLPEDLEVAEKCVAEGRIRPIYPCLEEASRPQ